MNNMGDDVQETSNNKSLNESNTVNILVNEHKEDDTQTDDIFSMSPFNKRKAFSTISNHSPTMTNNSVQNDSSTIDSHSMNRNYPDDNFNSLSRSSTWSRGVPSRNLNPKYHTINNSSNVKSLSFNSIDLQSFDNSNFSPPHQPTSQTHYKRELTQSLVLKKSPSDFHTRVTKIPVQNILSSSTPTIRLEEPDSPNVKKDEVTDDLVFVSRNFLPVIKGGTLDKLIERLTLESSTEWDTDYIDTFLLTYKSYISSKDLLNRLFDRYLSSINQIALSDSSPNESKQKIIKIRVTNVLKRWIMDYFHDFSNDDELVVMLRNGLKNVIGSSSASMLEKCLEEQIMKEDKIRKKEFTFGVDPPPSIIPKSSSFDDFDTCEMARQICLYQQKIYTSIRPKEALNQSWNKYKERSPNILRMIQFFNKLSRWVSTEIVLKQNLKDRVKTAKKILKVCGYLKEYNNFDSMQSILSGFNNSAVYRLTSTWEKLRKSKAYHIYTDCNKLLNTSKSYSTYRKMVETADPPIIPYLGVYLTDLTFIEDGNLDFLKVKGDRDDIINFDKMRKVAAVIKQICLYQQTPYNFKTVDIMQNFLEDLMPMNDRELFENSKLVEATQSPLKKKESFRKKSSFKTIESEKKK